MKKSLLCYFILILSFSNFNCQKTYLDITFGDNGITTTLFFTPKAINIQKDGKILVGGEIKRPFGSNSNNLDYMIYRFNKDGSIDEGFGIDGKVDQNTASNEYIMGLYETDDNKIVLLMKRGGPVIFKRFNSNGSLDTTLGSNGEKVFSFAKYNQIDHSLAMSVADDGKILLTGRTVRGIMLDPLTPDPFTYVARFNSDVTLDSTFNNIGYRTFTGNNYDLNLVSIDKNGLITTGFKGATIKILSNGQMDTSFGSNGIKNISLEANIIIKHLKSDQNGNYLLSGSIAGTDKRAFLLRYKPNGDVDSNYGSNGFSYIPNSSTNIETAIQSIFIRSDKTLTAIEKFKNGFDFGLVFTNSNGSTDNSIGDQGQIITEMNNDQRISVIEKQPDGKIIAAGYDSDRMILMRYDISEILNVEVTKTIETKIFPNPAKDFIYLEELKPLSIYIIRNSLGQILTKGITTSKNLKIDVSKYSTGNYFITTSGGTFKFIKQ